MCHCKGCARTCAVVAMLCVSVCTLVWGGNQSSRPAKQPAAGGSAAQDVRRPDEQKSAAIGLDGPADAVGSGDIRLVYLLQRMDAYEKQVSATVNDIKGRVTRIDTKATLNGELVSSSYGNAMGLARLAVGGAALAVAVTGLALGVGIYKLYVDRRALYTETREGLDEWCDATKENLGQAAEAHTEACEVELKLLVTKHEGELDRMHRFLALRELLRRPPIDIEEVKPLIDPLVLNPSPIYGKVFQKLIELNIDRYVTLRANQGLTKIKEVLQAQKAGS